MYRWFWLPANPFEGALVQFIAFSEEVNILFTLIMSVSHEEDKEETNSVLPAATTTTPSSAGDYF